MPERDVRFVNLQYNSSREEVREAVDNQKIEILAFPESETNDILEASCLLFALDNVVTVQNSNIHLCGALGVNCVGILPSIPEW